MTIYSDKVLKRTHNCGELRLADVGSAVRLCGWVRSYRDHGGVVFVDLRDREGITQVVFGVPDDDSEAAQQQYKLARALRHEWVISIGGEVGPRGEERNNPKLATGEIEVLCNELVLLNRSDAVPFEPDEYHTTSEENRLKYRYLDLRRPEMTKALRLRHQICRVMRNTLDEHDFVEVETPFLTRSTPEGARDFLVPSRMQFDSFYALPQSPQLFKQILMVGGLDRYYQVVRCFRDEDLRADRQPEFTQLDVELSFCSEQDVMDITNQVLRNICELCDKPFPADVPVIDYDESMRRFGTDRPDLRFGMELVDISDLASQTEFGVFNGALGSGGVVQCVVIPGGAVMTRKETDGLANWSKEFGAKGLANTKVAAGKTLETGVAKFLTPIAEELIERTGANEGDLICFGADTKKIVQRVLGELRSKMARERDLVPPGEFKWVWVVDFPLVEYNEDMKRLDVLHHPFTSPNMDDWETKQDTPTEMKSRAYDIVCNGMEMGGGSIRIHQPELQRKVFDLLDIGKEEAEEKFGFLLNALRYGAPPHGGIALGLDRVVMTMIGAHSIRDVIAFPKTQRGSCPLTNAPAAVDEQQLTDLDLKILTPPAEKQ
ncbi:MAG: aspartate--tRNA ligase [Phycisphaerae bacterium]|nr:aspartate--tRNA ligase [Phycisphaerae bacterium]